MTDPHTLDRLFAVLQTRRSADPEKSYTARLLAKGPDKIAKKVGEEGVEAAIEIVRGDRERLVCESADLLYHLLVAWLSVGVDPAAVWKELDGRVGGLEEKAGRKEQG